jgi:hypothetical protein
MHNLYRGPSIDASYQVSIHLAKGFQRRRLKCEKVNRRWMPSDGKSSHCLSQGEIKTGIESPCVSKFYARFVNKHRQFLFLIDRFLKKNLLL